MNIKIVKQIVKLAYSKKKIIKMLFVTSKLRYLTKYSTT